MKRSVNILLILWFLANLTAADKPCLSRKYNHSSVVCVCNADYCDEISKIKTLAAGQYVMYTTTMDGLRFEKSGGSWRKKGPKVSIKHANDVWAMLMIQQQPQGNIISIRRDKKHQEIFGFGGAFTDSTGINIKLLSDKAQRKLLQAYFGENGLEYNMARVPIGGTDFSLRPYAYNMKPENDTKLSNYSLTSEDFEYKIPFIKEAMSISTDKLFLVSATWSPPIWMKTNNDYGGECGLLSEYYQTWADYHLKFLELYAENGIEFWAMSTGNEPINGVVPIIALNSLGWMPTDQAEWIVNNLGPTIRNSSFSKIKLLALDDQRVTLPWWMEYMAAVDDTMDYIDGIATHYYWDELISTKNIDRTREMFPDKFLISTEACQGNKPWLLEKVELGSWARAESYITDIMEVLNLYYTGWIDWNLVLDRNGGPNWFNNRVDSTIISIPEKDEFLKQPMYYVIGHFSKFIPRGSVRISVDNMTTQIENVAFLRPDGGITVIISNLGDDEMVLTIEESDKGSFDIYSPAHSIQSIVYWDKTIGEQKCCLDLWNSFNKNNFTGCPVEKIEFN